MIRCCKSSFDVDSQSQSQCKPLALAPLGVFWDIENCAVPKGKSALVTVQRIRDRFFSRYTEAEFLCVCDIRKESPQVIQELNDAQVSVVHVSGNSKNAADDKLRQAMRRYADVYTSNGSGMFSHQQPPAILLISGDVNFSTDLSDLRYRKRLYVILLHNTHAPAALLVCAHEHYNFHSILEDLPNRAAYERKTFVEDKKDVPLKGGHCPMDVVVTDLPHVKNVSKLKNRLKKLSDNCGGKVVTIQGQFAVLRFPNKEAALRASKRMNGEDVFGTKIRVIYSSQMEFKTSSSSSHNQLVNLGEQSLLALQPEQSLLRQKVEKSLTPRQSKLLVSTTNFNTESILPVGSGVDIKISQASANTSTIWKSPWCNEIKSDIDLGIQNPHSTSHLVYASHSSTSNCPTSSSPNSSRDSSPITAPMIFPTGASSQSRMAGLVDHLTLKKEVASLLREVPNCTLPFIKFREMFEKRYRRSVSSSDLYRMKDVVSISDGSSTPPSASSSISAHGRIITLSREWQIDEDETVAVHCHVHPPQLLRSSSSHLGWAEKEVGALLPNVVVKLKMFSENLYNLLESHNGGFPLLSFLDCYESEFAPLQKVQDTEGVPLEHIISCVPGVEIIIGENGMKRAQMIMNKDTPEIIQPMGAQLLQLSRELIDLLKTCPRSSVPFSKLIPAYHHHFGRQCRVSDYGHVSLLSLLQTLPSTIQILGDTQNRVITLCHKAQMKRFATDVLRILKAQSGIKKQVQLEEFPEAYTLLFSKPFIPEDYGLCYLSDLVAELVENSSLVTLTKDDNEKTCLAIPKRGQTSFELQKMRLFAVEVVDLLRHSVRCEMPFSKFIPSYHHHFGKQCRVSAFGFSKLIELLDAIPDTVEIVGPTKDYGPEERVIRLTPKEQLNVIGEQLWNLIHKRNLEGKETNITELEDLFAHEHGYSLRPELCGARDLNDLCFKLSQFLSVRDERIELVDKNQLDQLMEDTKTLTLEDTPSSNDFKNNNHLQNRASSFKNKYRSPMKVSTSFNSISNGSYSSYALHYSRWENGSPNLHNVQPLTVLSPTLSSPALSPRASEPNVFTFDRQVQQQPPLSPHFYDMLVRDTNSPSVSPPLFWQYHPIVYPPPTPPGATPSMMMPTFTYSGPWSNNPASPTMLSSACFEHLSQK